MEVIIKVVLQKGWEAVPGPKRNNHVIAIVLDSLNCLAGLGNDAGKGQHLPMFDVLSASSLGATSC